MTLSARRTHPWAGTVLSWITRGSTVLACFSTPFDESAVAFLRHYRSRRTRSLHLRTWISRSYDASPPQGSRSSSRPDGDTGRADDAVRTQGDRCRDLVLLKCTSTIWPACGLKLLTIRPQQLLPAKLACPTTRWGWASVAAVAHGRHHDREALHLSRADGGVDSAFSLEPLEFRQLVVETERAWQALGTSRRAVGAETSSRALRRSVYVTKDISRWRTVHGDNLACLRPGEMVASKY